MKFIDLTGEKFGRLIVDGRNGNNNRFNKVMWNCTCDCGKKVVVSGCALKSGNTKSCGCSNIERFRKIGLQNVTHGMKGTRMYEIWHGMKARCFNTNSKDFKNYGGRGVTVCDEWRSDFQTFYDWAMANGYADNLTIDRIDVNGNYEPSNCRWITKKEQNCNQRRNVYLTFDGRTKIQAEWARETGLSATVISQRIKNGWSVEDALTTQPLIGKKNSIGEEAASNGYDTDYQTGST